MARRSITARGCGPVAKKRKLARFVGLASELVPNTRVDVSYDYIDVVQVWLREPLSLNELLDLNANARKMRLARDLGIQEPLIWAPKWKQTVRLCQPNEHAIQSLAKIETVLITYLELARDQSMDSQEQVDAGLQVTAEHFVQRWHGKRRMRFWENGNWRSGDLHRVIQRNGKEIRLRKIGTVFQAYGDRPSKVTGEINCLHLEAKIYGSSPIRRIGINHPRDLVGFDCDGFWKRNLRLFRVDRERLGRSWRNRENGTRTQTAKRGSHGYNVDRSLGNLIFRHYGMDKVGRISVQTLIDRIGRGPWLEPVKSLSRKGLGQQDALSVITYDG